MSSHWITETQTSEAPVPYAWLLGHYPATPGDFDACEAAAKATAANGVDKVWQCYVAGISPTNAASRFMATIAVDGNGMPLVSWDPKLSPEEEAKRTYTVEGKELLSDEWGATNAASRFFRVKVSMP